MMMVRTLRAQRASDTSGVNFRIAGDVVSSHFKGVAGYHLGRLCHRYVLKNTIQFFNPLKHKA